MRTRWSEAPNHYESLAVSVRAVLACLDEEYTYEELVAVLGLGGATVAVEGDPPGWWCTSARDAGLVETAARYGLRLRAMHPPAAAAGLNRSREYAQHFQDSYVPLIERALENDQFVLAWCGWPAPRERLWGVLTEASGQSLIGYTLWHDGKPLPLTGPAHQVYVVEGFSPPDEHRFTATARFLHAAAQFRAMWKNSWAPGGEIVTGAPAYEAWKGVLRSGSARGAGAVPLHKQLAQAARVHTAARIYLASWLRHVGGALAGENVALAAHWAAQCDRVCETLTPFESADLVQEALSRPEGVKRLRESLEQTAQAEIDVYERLESVR